MVAKFINKMWNQRWRCPTNTCFLKHFLGQPSGSTVSLLVNGHPWEANKICQLLFGNSPRYNELSWKMSKRASPMCSCGLSEENAYHFFFSCTLHDNYRLLSLPTTNLMRTEDCTSFKTFILKTKKLK